MGEAEPEGFGFLLPHLQHVLQLGHGPQHFLVLLLLLQQLLADFNKLSCSQPSQVGLLLLHLGRLGVQLLQLQTNTVRLIK